MNSVNRKKTDLALDCKNTVIELIMDVQENMAENDEERSDIDFLLLFFKGQSADNIMYQTLTTILPHKDKIRNKDMDYFKNNMSIFDAIPNKKRVEYYRNKIISGGCDEDHIDVLFDYFNALVSLSVKYKKLE